MPDREVVTEKVQYEKMGGISEVQRFVTRKQETHM